MLFPGNQDSSLVNNVLVLSLCWEVFKKNKNKKKVGICHCGLWTKVLVRWCTTVVSTLTLTQMTQYGRKIVVFNPTKLYKSPCKTPSQCTALSTNVMPEHLRFLKRCCPEWAPLSDSCKRINKSAPKGCDNTGTLWWFKWGRRKHWEPLVKGFLKRQRRALKSAPSTWTDAWSGKRLLSHKILRTVYFLTCLHCSMALSSHSKTNRTHQL